MNIHLVRTRHPAPQSLSTTRHPRSQGHGEAISTNARERARAGMSSLSIKRDYQQFFMFGFDDDDDGYDDSNTDDAADQGSAGDGDGDGNY